MHSGTVVGLFRYPVKSMQGEPLPGADLGTTGIPGDRLWAVRDSNTGVVLSAKREPGLMALAAGTDGRDVWVRVPDSDPLEAGDPQLDASLSDWLGRPVALARAGSVEGAGYQMNVDGTDESSALLDLPCPPGTFFDLAPVHLLSTSSMEAMARLEPDVAYQRERFRPTVLVDTSGDGFVEDGWIGRSVSVGTASVEPFMPTVRCAMTTRAQPGSIERDLRVLKSINEHHGASLGVYAMVSTPGRISVGDPITVS